MADLTAKNNTFHQLQEQAIVNPPVVDLFIVVPPGNNGSKTIDHKPSLKIFYQLGQHIYQQALP